ncbi:MAG: MarR family winged helix-turn-helix transcriptional regulator [Candidatus Enterenecus sp.]
MKQQRFEQLVLQVNSLHRNIEKIRRRQAASLGIKSMHAFWLYLLAVYEDGLSASELAAAAHIDRSLVSREIEDLEDMGYITTKEQTVHRRYGWKFILTPKGQEMARQVSQVSRSVQTAADRGIPPEDLAAFYRTLDAITRNLELLAREET